MSQISAGVHRAVVESLGRAIAGGRVSGRIEPLDLERRFGVSRSVVRESLRVLQAKGMVQARQRWGTHVTPIESWSVLDPDVILWRAAGPDRLRQLTEIQQLRSALEPQAAWLAAIRAREHPPTELDGALEQLARAAVNYDVEGLISADIAFHTNLLSASGNLLFSHLAPLVPAALRLPELADARGISADVVPHHAAVLRAIRAGKPQAAMQHAQVLLDHGGKLLDLAVARFRPELSFDA